MQKRTALLASAITLAAFSASAPAAPTMPAFEWINGNVTSFTAQAPNFTVAIVNNRVVRFCDPRTGADYPVNADNLFFDMLKTSFLHNQKVQVGVKNFGMDPQAGGEKLCIERVILTH